MTERQRRRHLAPSILLAGALLASACSSDNGPDDAQVAADGSNSRSVVDDAGQTNSSADPSDSQTNESDDVLTEPSNVQEGDTTTTTTIGTTSTTVAVTRSPPATDQLVEAANVDPDAEGDQPEPGSGTPDFDEELAAINLDSPCELYSANELGGLISGWSADAGVFAQLPSGLGSDTSVEFNEVSRSPNSCEWFSDLHVWFVGVSWDVADPTYIDTISGRFDDDPSARQFENGSVKGFVTDESTAQIIAGGLLVTVANLVPGSSTVDGDIDVTEALARGIAETLA
ncbi:MAG: hypothetical protein ACI81L_000446 [Verrucomicrobiales bacterium]|jgi:hypothetical protein